MHIDPQHTYVHLANNGDAATLPSDTFWGLPEAELARYGQGWLITEYTFNEDWPTWEMHPHGDEFVYLLSGAVELLLEQADGVASVRLTRSGAVVVPRGVWHTARISAPARMLHVTRGDATLTRPVQPG
jgi:mannose-6-phosphate isomerase-like protein (cupin superfamily)